MKTLDQPRVLAPRFTFKSDSLGYMIYCDGKPIGGARSCGSATHTSDGRRRSWQAVRADGKMHAETAQLLCNQLQAGVGPAHLLHNLPTL